MMILTGSLVHPIEPGTTCSPVPGDMLLSLPDKLSRQAGSSRDRYALPICSRGYPSLVKGAGFRVPSRRRSQVQLLLHASSILLPVIQ